MPPTQRHIRRLGAVVFILASKFQLEKNLNPIAGLVLEAKRTMRWI